jgi:hypothetical protein
MNPAKPYTVRWYDAEHTIVMCEIHHQWTWNDAYAALDELNQLSTSVSYGVYTIFHFLQSASSVPKGSAIPNLKNLVNTDQPNDQLTFFVGFSRLLEGLMNIAGNVYGIKNVKSKLRFVNSLDMALEQIQQHKSQQADQNP